MNTRTSFRRAGRMAVAVLTSTALLSTAVTAPVFAQTTETTTAASTSGASNNWGFSEGEKGVISATGKTYFQPPHGDGVLTAESETVKAGSVVTFTGKGFKKADVMNIKFEDGRYNYPDNERFPQNQDPEYFKPLEDASGKPLEPQVFVGGNEAITLQDKHLPGDDGNFTFKVRIPSKIPNGWYWVRVLNPNVSQVAWFKVTGGNAEGLSPIVTKLESAGPGKTYRLWGDRGYEVRYDLTLSHATEGERLVARSTVGNSEVQYPVKFAEGRRSTTDSVTVSDTKAQKLTVVVPNEDVAAGKALAFQGHTITLYKQGTEEKVASLRLPIDPFVAFGATDGTSRPNSSVGSTAKITVHNLPKGNIIKDLHVGGKWDNTTHSFTGGTSLLSGEQTIGDDYGASFDVTIPKDDSLAGKPIDIVVSNHNATSHFATGVKITTDNAEFGADQFTITKHELKAGLYQAAFSKKENALYVTRRGRTDGSNIYKLNGDTFAVEKELDIPAYPSDYHTNDPNQTRDLYHVFGIAVNDKFNTLYVTNTLDDTLTSFKLDDLKKLKSFPKGTIPHPRAIGMDKNGKMYFSAPFFTELLQILMITDNPALWATLTEPYPFDLPDGVSGTMGFATDMKNNVVYSPSLNESKVTAFDAERDIPKLISLPEGTFVRGTDAAIDENRNHLFVVGQGSNNLVVIDTMTGNLVNNIPTGDSPLSVDYDPKNDKIFVANRNSGTVSVFDGATLKQVANLNLGANPNWITHDDTGRVFVVNKRSQIDGSTTDDIYTVKWTGKSESTTSSTTETTTPPTPTQKPTTAPEPKPTPKPTPKPEPAPAAGSGKAALPIVGVVAVLAAVIGSLVAFAGHGGLPPQLLALLPAPIRQALHL